jgi:hypothetical protein
MKALRSTVIACVLALSAVLHAAPSTLSHLGGIQEVRSWFNSYKGHPRLILLMSPT